MSYSLHPYLVDFGNLPTIKLPGYELEQQLRGQFLSNQRWSSMRMSWFDTVDDALKGAGVDVVLSNYFYAGAPCPMVMPDDFPMVGHIKPSELAGLKAKLEAADLTGDEGEAVHEVCGWLTQAKPHQGIVTFYY